MRKHLIALLLVFVACCCAPTTQETAPPRSEAQSSQEQSWREVPPSEQSAEPMAAGPFATPPDGAAEPGDFRPPTVEPSPEVDASSPRPRASRDQWNSAPEAQSTPSERGPVGTDGYDAPATSAEAPGRALGRSRSAAKPSQGKSKAAAPAASGAGGGALVHRPRPAPRPKIEDRPGLGTSWGETRYSSVSEAPFERDSSRPHYSASLLYNDARGAEATAGSRHYGTQASIGLGTALTLSLRDEYGNTFSAYRGSGKTVAIGRHGQRYTLVVQNRTNERFEVVLSVDGLDVIDGRDAGYGKRGYLIGPYGSIEVDGFRKSTDAVAAFRFGSVRNSYAARTGSARNVGVIGAAAFGERGYSARLQAYRERMYALRMRGVEVERRRSADPFPNGYAAPPLELAR